MNQLYYGDCLTIMKEMPQASVDLIYLDPPFNSKRAYNAIYKDETGRPLPDQIEAFCDMWEMDQERERAIREMPRQMSAAGLDEAAQLWGALPGVLRARRPDLLAYLSYMAERLLLMRGLLKPKGSIYLHCDPTASHYLKILMDGIWGHENFRNEITWCYKSRPQSKRYFGRKHDTILFYSMGDDYCFNTANVARPLSKATIAKYKLIDKGGRLYRLQGRGITGSPIRSAKDVDAKWEIERPELTVRDYLDEKKGVILEDWWTDVGIINQSAKERLGYSTQKPLALLDRIIAASSNEGDVVFDPFCGCATTLEAAHKLNRRWIGIDIAIHAIKRVARVRLQDRLGLIEGQDFTITGVPRTLEGARDLWRRDPYNFQKWAVEAVEGFVTARKTADRGIDGRLYFEHPKYENLQSLVLEVKGGTRVGISAVRDLRGVLEREGALMAGLIVLENLSEQKLRNFKREMAAAGEIEINGKLYPRMQMRTVAQILEDQLFDTPSPAAQGPRQPVLPGSTTKPIG